MASERGQETKTSMDRLKQRSSHGDGRGEPSEYVKTGSRSRGGGKALGQARFPGQRAVGSGGMEQIKWDQGRTKTSRGEASDDEWNFVDQFTGRGGSGFKCPRRGGGRQKGRVGGRRTWEGNFFVGVQ